MICSSCQRDANDNPVAYYAVPDPSREQHVSSVIGKQRPIYKCWNCLSPAEKPERDSSMKDPRRFKMDKTIKETTS